ncbi:sulfurtransferase [Vibrio parahaemolyticus]|uniref:sulfurtransferase n=1 Tax=Vibrio parahaemolyticus TaxID=670 RepID=UPI001A2A2F58|nr:sulfurtransferase [Vibrio parahaemolyticus]EHW0643094.1 sulfurtransferase [Vibrio parahaemolyticus]EHZ2742040.1 sulfurtransferase [Vibrio parahaemolyticus]MBE4160261.1 sulfurtransferase [Vibrio parahaemolyticus]MDG2997244.1 sulfurtransferase [Vibrio parahaemolyticus]HAS6977659.1 sulfurtransferase [Vibrio parahaemolyticus]
MNSVLVNCQWLEEHLYDENIVVLDVSMDKVVGKTPLVYDTLQVIPTSLKCNLEVDFSDINSDSINAFPTQLQFDKGIAKLGIGQNSTVILYDNQGVYSSPRAWWIFKTMGFDRVYILNGGLPQWIREKRQTLSNHKCAHANVLYPFKSSLRLNSICSSEYVLENIPNDRSIVLDARSNLRFLGEEKEPRSGCRSGHIPNSINLPFTLVLDGFKFKNKPELSDLFINKLPLAPEELIFSCGSGITACIVLVAAVISGFSNLTLYDGSWAEWGSSQYPVSS